MSEEDKKKIARLMQATTPKKPRPPKKPKPPKGSNIFYISGNGNITAGGDIHINQPATPPQRPKVVVQTGVGVITAKQKAYLKSKIDQFLAARNTVRTKPMTIAAAWKAINSAVGVNSYHEMTPDQYRAALTWLSRHNAIVGSMKSAPIKIEDFRSQMISAIKARARQLGDMHYYANYATETFGFSSLASLTDQQLQQLRAWIMSQKKKKA